MARLLQSLRRVLGLNTSKPAPPAFARSFDTNFSYFRGKLLHLDLEQFRNADLLDSLSEGDRVIINGKNPSLTKPLRHGHKFDTRRGVLPHDSIIGGRVRDVYKSHKGQSGDRAWEWERGYPELTSLLTTRRGLPTFPPYPRRLCLHDASPGNAGMRLTFELYSIKPLLLTSSSSRSTRAMPT